MTDFLMLAFVFLVAGVLSVPIATRLGLGSVLGYLIAGIAIAPVLSALHVDVIQIQHFAEFGVVMMLFLVGLELEPKRLWEMRMQLLGLGGGQVALTALLIAGAGIALGLGWTVALATGLVLSLSSTAIVLQTLQEKGLMTSDGGRASFSVLLTQDIAVIPMLALMPLLALPDLQAAAHGGEGDHGAGLSLVAGLPGWQATLVTLAAVALVVVIGTRLTRPLFRFIAAADLRELFTATALLLIVAIALLMSLVGLSPALGTFIAGVVLAGSAYRHELESDIDPFRGLLLGLFFMTVGAGIDFGLLVADLPAVLGLTLGLIALKAAVLYALARLSGQQGANRWLFTLGLAQAGEFGFVLLSFAVAGAILPEALADRLLLVVALSMLLTPALFILWDRAIRPRYLTGDDRAPDTVDTPGEVIIAGHGRVGGIVRQMIEGQGWPVTVIDHSAAQLEMLETFGIRAYYGDATRPDMLESAGIREARMLVVAIDAEDAATDLVRYVRQTFPDVHVIARARGRHHVYALYAAGCRDIVRETFDGAVRIGRSALEALGTPHDEAMEMAEGFVSDDTASLIATAPHFRPDVPPMENAAYIAKAREVIELRRRLAAEDGPSFGRMRAALKEQGDDVEEIARREDMAISPSQADQH